MWYKIARENIGGGVTKFAPMKPVNDGINPLEVKEQFVKQITGLEQFNSELLFLLEKMGKTIEDYYEMSAEEHKHLWDILVYRPHHIGGSEAFGDSSTGTYGDQMSGDANRMQSAYHDYDMTNTEGRLESSRHRNNIIEPINMQTYEKSQGEMLIRGIPQYNSGKIVEREDVPSNIRWV